MFIKFNLFRDEASGLTQKSYAILTKVALIYTAARETLELMKNGFNPAEDDPVVQCEVATADVKAGWSLVSASIETHKNFKVRNGEINFNENFSMKRFI